MEEEKKGEEENKDEKEEEMSKGEEKDIDGQQDQRVQDTQLPPPSPPHTITPAETIKIKDVVDISCQNINP